MSSTILFSFLGTGDYQPTGYWSAADPDRVVETPFVALALAQLHAADRLVVFATPMASRTNGEALQQACATAGLPAPELVSLPEGRNPAELWQAFDVLRSHLAAATGTRVLFDITHGFRAQPFFAASVIAYARGLRQGPDDLRIVYGAFEARERDSNRTPLWDLTAFAEVIDWSNALEQLLTTGNTASAAQLASGLGRRLAREWAAAGKEGARPELDKLGRVLQGFGDALDTVRVGELLLGLPNCGKAGRGACARELLEAIAMTRPTVVAEAPPLAPLLDEIARMAEPLAGAQGSLGNAAGLDALVALVRLYLRFGRTAEAAAVLREAWVSAYADAAAACPGDKKRFSKSARAEAEACFNRRETAAQTIAEVRNDIEHAGFRARPLPAETIRRQLERLTDDFEERRRQGDLPPAASEGEGRVYLVTRHPGAKDWAAGEGLAVDEVIDHLEPERIDAGDTVIGSLPVSLAASVCERGARYLHLSLTLPAEVRGHELSADDLRRLGARVERFTVRRSE
jgi:CRISPR-associated protein Csx16